jgi:TolB protein
MRVILVFLLVIFAYGEKLQITKFVTNDKPKILIQSQNLPSPLKNMINIDTKLISHYDVTYNSKDYNISNYVLDLKYQNKSLTAKMTNLLNKKVVLYKKYKIPGFNVYPFMIHSLSYDINDKLGFQPVKWIKKRIVYSVYTSPKENSIFIADITLHYRKKIISGGLNIFPKWANKTQSEIYYTKLEDEPVLYKYNIYTGQKTRIFSSRGMLIVSDVKGDTLLLTLAINDQPDIYKYNISSHSLEQITHYPGIDVNGQFYDNSILFISDRLGYPNVYQKTSNLVKRFIYQGRNHISVSAYKNKAVVSSRETNKAFGDNTFNLWLINKDTNIIKRLTFGGKNMMPVFASENTILFIKEYKFNSKLGIIRLDENKVFYFKLSQKMQSFDF